MGDRVPFVSIGESLDPFVGVDLPIGTVDRESHLEAASLTLTGVSSSGDVVVEIRDATSALLTVTIGAAARSAYQEAGSVITIPASTALFQRVTSAGTNAAGLSGWWKIADTAAAGAATLTALDTLKLYANIDDTTHDALLLWLIAGVSADFQAELDRKIVLTAVTGEKYNGRGRYPLTLRHFPIDASSVEVTLEGTLLGSSDIDVEEEEAQVFYTPSGGDPTVWPKGFRNISVDYTHGYATVPPDVVKAVTKQCAFEWKRSGPKGFSVGVRSTEIPEQGSSVYLVDAWLPDVRKVIENHRAPRIFE